MSAPRREARPPTLVERLDNMAGRLDLVCEELSQRVLGDAAPGHTAFGPISSDDLFVLKDACRHTMLARNLLLRVLKEDPL
jgi:hypothetical protein